METVRTVAALRARVRAWRGADERVALVPTMGALHEGHLGLVTLGRANAGRVVATIFVNPTQFGPNEDLAAYPSDEARDAAMLERAGCDLIFAPGLEEMYPPGFATRVRVEGLTDCLCGAARPGHFDGVAQVVTKLLNQAQADVAVFGEKDWQQLVVIRRLARDLDIPTEIISAPIAREADGLAMSSRNRYLDEAQRAVAAQLNRVIRAAADRIAMGAPAAAEMAAAAAALMAAGFDEVDYVECREADSLAPVEVFDPTRPARVFAAAHLGRARLIDNVPVAHIGSKPVRDVVQSDVLRVLAPIWTEKPQTARLVRQRLRTVLNWARTAGHFEGVNPVEGVEEGLAKQKNRVKHHAAMPWGDVPGFMNELGESIMELALRFLILTAARSGEVRGARWSEINTEERLWIIPADRMKSEREHRVPLSDEALEVLERVRGLDPDLVFPGQKRGRPMPDTTLLKISKRMGREGTTVHDLRSSFRDWAEERGGMAREIAELSLAHEVGNATERAYRRSDLLDKRRDLMERWARFCLPCTREAGDHPAGRAIPPVGAPDAGADRRAPGHVLPLVRSLPDRRA